MTRINDKTLESLVKNHRYNVYKVTWIGDPRKNWLITKNDVGMSGGSFKTKRKAVKQAREIASRRENRPSVLIIEYKKPGGDKRREASVSEWQEYN